MRKQRYKTSSSSIILRIDVDWDNSDVDMVFSELQRTFRQSHVCKSITPTSDSVHRFQQELFDASSNGNKLLPDGVEVKEFCGLMMGCCSIEFDVNMSTRKFSELESLSKELNKIVSKFVSRYVRYYSKGTKKSSGGIMVTSHS